MEFIGNFSFRHAPPHLREAGAVVDPGHPLLPAPLPQTQPGQVQVQIKVMEQEVEVE